jgi:hypothetical protein
MEFHSLGLLLGVFLSIEVQAPGQQVETNTWAVEGHFRVLQLH